MTEVCQSCYRDRSDYLVRLLHWLLEAWFEHTLLSWHRCLMSMGGGMELRHRVGLVAVADAESLTVAAGRKLHTSQPFVEPADLGS